MRFFDVLIFLGLNFSMQFSRNNSGDYSPNGDKGIRTLDPLLARQVLSQLSYTPKGFGSHLSSHAVTGIVFSAAQVLTIVFGMGTGVSPARIATKNFIIKFTLSRSLDNLTVKQPLLHSLERR